LHEWAQKMVFWPCKASISGSKGEAPFSLCRVMIVQEPWLLKAC